MVTTYFKPIISAGDETIAYPSKTALMTGRTWKSADAEFLLRTVKYKAILWMVHGLR